MTRQLSSAFSDLILSVTCAAACKDIFIRKESVHMIYGIVLLGLASALGTLRFSGLDSFRDFHRSIAVHAGAVGVPWTLLLFASIQLNKGGKLALVSAGWDILVIIGMHVCTTQYTNTRQMLVPATLLGLLYSAIINNNQYFLVSGICFMVAGVVGATGTVGPFQRMDVFHVALAGAVYCLRSGILLVV